MKRRDFIKSSSIFGTSLALAGHTAIGSRSEQWNAELAGHVIKQVELLKVNYSWPRFVGKNGRIDFHGQHKTMNVARLITDTGIVAWGMTGGRKTGELVGLIKNKRVDELIRADSGLIDPKLHPFDMALHDLMGKILDKPVYKLLGGEGSKGTPIYSGMIYLDELNEGNPNKSIDIILDNCQWDYEYGYRQLKVKIGRSGRWYPHAEGLARDIEVVNEIHKAFHAKGVRLLVDANNMYSLEDTIAFLKGVKGVPLLWVEEPFQESVKEGRLLRRWMNDNGFSDTLYADGEAKPDHDVLMELSRSGDLDAYLSDIVGYGFTPWRKLMPKLKKMGTVASPHAWGSAVKTNAITHIAASLGNCVTIEGVTCVSDEVDFGDYHIKDGLIHVSESAGFGMKLLI